MSIKRFSRQLCFALLTGCGTSEVPLINTMPSSESVETTQPAHAAAVSGFSKTVGSYNASFTVTSPNKHQGNSFHFTSKGLTIVNIDETVLVNGVVTDLLIGEIDGDNYPEVVVVTQSGDNKAGKAYIYSSNNGKSMSQAFLQERIEDPVAMQGYKGYDEFSIVKHTFVRRFPLFEGRTRSGKYRQFLFRMENGEASKILRLYKTL